MPVSTDWCGIPKSGDVRRSDAHNLGSRLGTSPDGGHPMNLVALIAFCLSSAPVSRCQRQSAVHWFALPEPSAGLAECMREGMISAARSRLLNGGVYPRGPPIRVEAD